MAQLKWKQNTFTNGELGARLAGRYDLDAYHKGCDVMWNYMPLFTGGFTTRPGTNLVGYDDQPEELDSNVKMVTFLTEDTNFLVFFCVDNIQIMSSNGTWLTEVSYDMGATPSVAPSLISCYQCNNTLYFTSTAFRPRKLVFDGVDTFTCSLLFDYTTKYTCPPMGNLITDVGITSITNTSGSEYTIVLDDDYFENKHIESFMYVFFNELDPEDVAITTPHQYYFHIDSVSDATTATVTLIDFGGNTGYSQGLDPDEITEGAIYEWAVCVYDGDEAYGTNYPAKICLHNTRLYLLGIEESPQTQYGSVSDDYKRFSYLNYQGQVDDTCAVSFYLDATQQNEVMWAKNYLNSLIIGTTGGEYSISASDGFIKPSDLSVTRISGVGCQNYDAIICHNNLVFISKYGQRVKQMSYDYVKQSYQPFDLMYLNDTITDNTTTITAMAWQQYPDYVLWCIRSDGTLLGLTYVPDQNILAWFECPSLKTDDSMFLQFEQICVVPGSGSDQIFLLATANDKHVIVSTQWSRTLCLEATINQWCCDATTYCAPSQYRAISNGVLEYAFDFDDEIETLSGDVPNVTCHRVTGAYSHTPVGTLPAYTVVAGSGSGWKVVFESNPYSTNNFLQIYASPLVGDKIILKDLAYDNMAVGFYTTGARTTSSSILTEQNVTDGKYTLTIDAPYGITYGQQYEGYFVGMDIVGTDGSGFCDVGVIRKIYTRLYASDLIEVSTDGVRWVNAPWLYDSIYFTPTAYTGDKEFEVMGDSEKQARVYIKSKSLSPVTVLAIRADLEVGK